MIETHSNLLESIVQGNRSFESSHDAQESHSSGLNGTQPPGQISTRSSVSTRAEKNVAWQAHGLQTASPIQVTSTRTEQPPNLSNPSLGFQSPSLEENANSGLNRPHVSQAEEFPAYDLLYSLVELYFSHVNTWCPILDRRSTLNLLFGSRILEEADRVLLHAIVTTSLRFSTDSRLSDERTRKEYYNRSKQKVLVYGIENSSVRALQAMVILALDVHGSSSIGSGLKMIACIVRSALMLGLTTESSSSTLFPNYPSISTLRANVLPEPEDWIEDESRRRLFWMIYVLDRDATVATAFEFTLDEKDIDRKLPCRDELFGKGQPVLTPWFRERKRDESSIENSQNLGTFSYQVEVRGILTQIHQFLKRPMDVSALADVSSWQKIYRELDMRLKTWQLALPAEYGNFGRLADSYTSRSPLSPGWVLLQTFYYL